MKIILRKIVSLFIASLIIFIAGDLLSPISKLIEISRKKTQENKILKVAYSNKTADKNEDLNCHFFNYDEFVSFISSLSNQKYALELVDYLEQHSRKANFVTPDIKNYLTQNNYKFAMPYNLNKNWTGRLFLNDNGNIKTFPSNIFEKGEYFENNPSKFVYYYFTKDDFIDYLVCSGMPPKIAIDFEKKLRKPDFSKESENYGNEDTTLLDSTRHIMNNMGYTYSIPVVNGVWNTILNIKRNDKIYTITSNNFKFYSKYFHYESHVPIDVNGTTYNYIFYDYNWELFSKTFFNSHNLLSIINEMINSYTVENLIENEDLVSEVKNKMIEGNYMFSEPYFPETNKCLGIRNVMINNKFYTFISK